MSALGVGMRRRLGWVAVAVLVLTSACARPDEEPGLFGRQTDPPTAAPSAPSPSVTAATPTVNPELPVVGEQVWTSADGLDVQVRIAVHAVRRVPGATVLDWSVTPLRAPHFTAGDAIPSSVDLGLTRWHEDNLNLFLVDVSDRHVYRPLTVARPGRPRCLCTSLVLAAHQMRIGQTRLLQISYPELPPDVASIDVDVATVPIFFHVPVTAAGFVPQATSPTDLARAADTLSVAASTRAFRYAAGGQRFIVSVDEVVASNTFTAVRWTIQTLTDGAGLQLANAPPFAAADAVAELDNPVSASGPHVILRGRRAADLSYRQATLSRQDGQARECLCTDLRVWSSALRGAQQLASVATTLPPLPIGAEQVDVTFPGLAALKGIRLTSASDGTVRSAVPLRRTVRTYRPDQTPSGWSVDRWPTPVPRNQLHAYDATVDRLVG